MRFVANLEMHGKGTFFDPRLDDAARFPIAARERFGHVRADEDLITPQLPALQLYQLALPAPAGPARQLRPLLPRSAAQPSSWRQGELRGLPRAAALHRTRLEHAHRRRRSASMTSRRAASPDGRYRTTPLRGLWTHTTGGFYHDGRFPTLAAVIDHYDSHFSLGLIRRREE